MKKQKMIFWGSILCVALVIILSGISREKARKLEVENCLGKVNEFSNLYGVDIENAEISGPRKDGDWDRYTLRVDGIYRSKSYRNLYLFVKNVEDLFLDLKRSSSLSTQIQINGKYYKIDVLDEKKLVCDHEVVFTYRSNNDLSMAVTLKNQFPYVGLKEEYIDLTILGAADEKNYCRDYTKLQHRAQSIEYRWYDNSGNLQAIATVRHWDYERKCVVDAYISSIIFWGEYSYLNE